MVTVPRNDACKACGARWRIFLGKVGEGWALVHNKGCTALAPRPAPTAVP